MDTKSGRYTTLSAALTYALLTAALTLPNPSQLTGKLLGNNIDNWIFYWNNWWLKQAIESGQSWFFTNHLFFPQGTSLLQHSNSFLNSLLSLPLQALNEPVLAYNLVLLFGLWIGALGAFLLVNDLTGQAWPAWLAGIVFALAPYHLTRVLAQSHLGSIHWWPWYVWALHRLLTRQRWSDAMLAGLFAALTLWSGLQLALLLMLWTAVYLPWILWQTNPKPWRTLIPQLLLLAAVALLLSLPLLSPLIQNWDMVTATARFTEGENTQTDLLAYLTPPTYHPIWGDTLVDTYHRFEVNQAFMPYLGFGVLVLALLAILRQRQKAGPWLVSGLVWLLFALGTKLRVNGTVYDVTLPYSQLENVFPISTIRSPDRFNLLLVLSLAVLAGLGAAELARWRHHRRLLLLATGVLLLDYAVFPIPAWELPPDSPALVEMAQDGRNDAVVDYPMGYTQSKIWLYYQTRHGKPIVEGHVSRYTAGTYAFIGSQPILQRLYVTAEPPANLQPGALAINQPLPALGPALRDLQAAGVGKILVHLPYANPEDLAYFHQVLPLIPVHTDESLAVYDLSRPRPYRYGTTANSLPNDITLLQSQLNLQEGQLHTRLLTRLDGITTSPLACRMTLGNQSVPITLYPAGPDWQPGDLAVQEVSLPLPAAAGLHPILLTCNNFKYTLPDRLDVSQDGVRLLRQPLDLRFADNISLTGYRDWTTGSDLTLALHWQSQAPVETDYKVFAHLLDENGTIVRQYDAVPCGWDCPTTGWQPGQRIVDEIHLPLAGLPPAAYTIAVGLYDAGSGERPSVLKSDGTAVPESYFILPEEFKISVDQ